MRRLGRTLVFISVILMMLIWVMLAIQSARGAEPASRLLDLPPEVRTHNYGPSCMHAAIQDVLKWHGLHDLAAWWRQHKRGSFGVDRAAGAMDRLGLQYAYTNTGDESFLEWCSRNGHGAAIHYFSVHAVTFCGYDGGYAILQDNNRTDELIRVPKDKFVQKWKGYGGRAITVVYSPYPPEPRP